MTIAYRSFNFTDSIGVNTHLSDNLGPYGNTTQVKSELDYVGIHYVRDSQPFSWSVSSYSALLNTGVKIDLVIAHNPGEELGNGDLQANLAIIDQLASLAPASIIALEGLNEPNNFPDLYNGQATSNWSTIALVQSVEQADVKADQNLSGIPLLSPSIDPSNIAGAPADFTATSDLGNAHVYPWGGNQPAAFIAADLSGQQTLVHGKLDWITEFGYSNTPKDSSYGVDSSTQAKNTLNGILDAFKAGVPKTFLYQLLDETSSISPDTSFGALGLFNADGTPKPVAVALHNLSTILADSATNAATFQPGSLDFTIAGLPPTASQLLLEKADGTYELVIWNESTDWNPSAQSEISPSSIPVTIATTSMLSQASVIDPLTSSLPLATYSTTNSIQLTLTDHPVIIEMKPQASASQTAQMIHPPTISTVTGIPYTGVRLNGTSEAGSTVTVTDTVGGTVRVLGTATASSGGIWSFTSVSGLGHIDLSTVHDYSALGSTAAGATGRINGGLFLTDTHQDVLSATSGASDVFAIMSDQGSVVINGFQTSSAGGSGHNVIDFSGRGISSFSQLQGLMSGSASTIITLASGKTTTLTGINPHSLSASDFRFS